MSSCQTNRPCAFAYAISLSFGGCVYLPGRLMRRAADLGGHDGSYHTHSMIRIFIDGVETDPDSDIGVDQTRCMYWVHTHDGTGGVIHVEAPGRSPMAIPPMFGGTSILYVTANSNKRCIVLDLKEQKDRQASF